MISLKTFHLFFISLSIILTIGYGIYELIVPSNPGMVSVIFALISFAVGCALIFYCFRVIQKFKTI
jgi:multisubunit Na+/H+ antiporter MnhC subunit